MDKNGIIEMVKDYRIAIYLILTIASVIIIFPHPTPTGIETNLQFGLDLDGGSWLQLEYQAIVVKYKSEMTIDKFIPALKEKIEGEVLQVDEDTLEIRKGLSEEEIRNIFSDLDTTLISYTPGVTKETANDIKRIMENKINSLGTQDAKVYVITGLNGMIRFMYSLEILFSR